MRQTDGITCHISGKKAGAETIIAVIGHGAEQVKEGLKEEEILFALQEKQLGTGHAVMQAADRFPTREMYLCSAEILL